ncbi:unnamed protein product [Ranitomeya imitator]|uniref:C2 domain-containing protein n=1 Tax=Ranitomeya imitator TaxID=111125 RepID=A0ABN9MPQ2_9NEOB|nr:unnamed protein product [Ranitomeya imitator]
MLIDSQLPIVSWLSITMTSAVMPHQQSSSSVFQLFCRWGMSADIMLIDSQLPIVSWLSISMTSAVTPCRHNSWKTEELLCRQGVTADIMGVLLSGEEDCGSHCYVLGALNTHDGQTEAQTALVKRKAHTVWEEALLFPLKEEDRADATLTLTLRNCDRFSRHQVAGEITLSLANVGIPFGTARWVDLRAPEKNADSSGEVLLSMSYLPAANRLIVVLIKARNIHSDQSNNLVGKDLFVKVTLWHQTQRLKRKQSKRAKHKINPVWNEMIMFEVPPELLGEVSVEVGMLSQEPSGGPSQALGSCYLGSDRTGSGKSHWREMISNPRRQIAIWHRLLP